MSDPSQNGATGDSTVIGVVAVSDTHSLQAELEPLDPCKADIFIHCGDITNRGTLKELDKALDWIASLPFKHKIVVAGNHDVGLDKDKLLKPKYSRPPYPSMTQREYLIAQMESKGIIYLHPENPRTEIEVNGAKLRIYGLPHTPEFFFGPGAFARPRSQDTWNQVTEEHSYDILISHSPPRGILDKTMIGTRAGCDFFLAAIERVKPLVALWGHIHEANGATQLEWEDGTKTDVFNVASMIRGGSMRPPKYFSIKAATR
jgi:predicted phosphodiesterase